MILILFTGLVASMAHVITGPDHLAAVTPLAINLRSRSWIIGFCWGIGHVTGMAVIGLLFLSFRKMIPLESISRNSEPLVGFLLIAVGIWAISRITACTRDGATSRLHFHFKPAPYLHKHDHVPGILHMHQTGEEKMRGAGKNGLSALGIGFIHGIAGISHLAALLPSLALPGTLGTVVYLTGFSIGTIMTMVIFSLPLGLVAQKLALSTQTRLLNIMTLSGGSLAILTGFVWLGISFSY